jgi:hypothetical protein
LSRLSPFGSAPETYPVSLRNNTATEVRTRVVVFARIRVTNTRPRIATRCQAWLVDVERSDGLGGFKPTIFTGSIQGE